jgi:hypothetical protein
MSVRLEECLLRRYELARSGFHFDVQRGQWRRGRLSLSEEEVDRRLGWRRAVQGWMRTRPRRRRRTVFSPAEDASPERRGRRQDHQRGCSRC